MGCTESKPAGAETALSEPTADTMESKPGATADTAKSKRMSSDTVTGEVVGVVDDRREAATSQRRDMVDHHLAAAIDHLSAVSESQVLIDKHLRDAATHGDVERIRELVTLKGSPYTLP